MKIKELIEKLQTLPSDLPIVVNYDGEYCLKLNGVYRVRLTAKGNLPVDNEQVSSEAVLFSI